MGKRSRRKVGARRYADYSEETLTVAVDLVKSKALSSYEAEKQFGIPRRTILNKCRKRHTKAVGRPQELSAEEEKHIAEVVEVAADFGSPLTILDLRIVVYNYLAKCGKTDLFKGQMPGERWARNFLARHNFTQRATQNIKRSRASKTVEEMTAFYQNLESSLKDIPCENIFNFDETNLSDDPGSTKAIFKRGTKHPERVLNSTKSSVSIMFSGTADGQCLPPYVVYKAEHLWSRWCEFGPPNARYNRTKSGWFDMVCFDDWFKTIIIPWAKSRGGQKLVIGDNLASHLSIEVLKLCQENNIRLVFLPPNATHLTQPLDVAFFGPMKRCWREILLNYKLAHQNSTAINKCDFPQLLLELMTKISMSKCQNLRSGFAAAGIFPFNPSRVLKKIPVVSAETSKNFDVCLLEYLKNMRTSTTQSRNSAHKKLAVIAGKSISTEEAEKINKGKGKGKSTKKCNLNADLNIVSFPVLQQPKSLKELSTKIVNKLLLLEDETVNSSIIKSRKKRTTKKKTQSSNVNYLSQVSKTDNENLPFISLRNENLPTCLQTSKAINSGNGSRLKPAKDLGITILSDVIIKPGQSNTTEFQAKRSESYNANLLNSAQNSQVVSSVLTIAGPSNRSTLSKPKTRADLKNQHTISEHINLKRKRVTLTRERSVLQTTPIPSSNENVIKLKKEKQQKYKVKNISMYSGSTTSVSDDMSEHSDSSIMDMNPESDGADSEDFPLYCFKKPRSLDTSNSNSDPETPALNYLDDQISDDDMLFETDCQAKKASRTASRRRVNHESCSMISTGTNSKIALFPSICEPTQTDTSDSQAPSPPITEDSIFNNTCSNTVLSDKIPSLLNYESEMTPLDYSVNDKVLVRYYIKNKWKYYIGVILACNSDDTFDISFYATTRIKGELKFKKPKKIDRDTVPIISIEKIITIDKISEKPEEYKLQNQADAIYF